MNKQASVIIQFSVWSVQLALMCEILPTGAEQKAKLQWLKIELSSLNTSDLTILVLQILFARCLKFSATVYWTRPEARPCIISYFYWNKFIFQEGLWRSEQSPFNFIYYRNIIRGIYKRHWLEVRGRQHTTCVRSISLAKVISSQVRVISSQVWVISSLARVICSLTRVICSLRRESSAAWR